MPKGNKTGPEGMGPMTGRRMGFCVNNEHPGSFYSNSNRGDSFAGGRGFGRGRGGGFQHRNRMGFNYGNYSNSSMESVSEKTLIENEIKVIKEQLLGLEDKLQSLNKD